MAAYNAPTGITERTSRRFITGREYHGQLTTAPIGGNTPFVPTQVTQAQ